MTVVYSNQRESYDQEQLDTEVTLCYAMTVHKAQVGNSVFPTCAIINKSLLFMQGSEFPVVVLPMFMTQSNMLRRKLLYTALTRGKDLVVIVGEKAAVFAAALELRSSNTDDQGDS